MLLGVMCGKMILYGILLLDILYILIVKYTHIKIILYGINERGTKNESKI